MGKKMEKEKNIIPIVIYYFKGNLKKDKENLYKKI